jgi:N-methylhydantoinase B
MNNLTFGGWDAVRNKPFAYYETIAGGMGAGPAFAGRDAVHTHMTNSWNTPVEAFERQFPVRVTAYSIRTDSGGRGAHRGGDGIVRQFEFLAPASLTILSDRRRKGPYGLAGGSPGSPGRNTLVARGGTTSEIAAKACIDIAPGDRFRIETPGGGGWGA